MSCCNEQGRLQKGEALYLHAVDIIPGGTQTNAKKPPENLKGAYPPFIARGQGAYVWDIDDNRYIDHKLGCGPVVLGHAYPAVVEAAEKQLRDGLVYGSSHPSEVTLAELLIDTIPCAEMARLLKCGAEGTSAAVRVARTYTGRELILSSGYHGWHDWGMAKIPSIKGIPECMRQLTLDVPYGDYQRLEDLFKQRGNEIAAFIISAPYHDTPENVRQFYAKTRSLCDQYGALLIYDEIVTGYRLSIGGLQGLIGVLPDLAVVSKGMANGFPIGALVGRREYMRAWENTTISSTFGGEAVSIAASIASITEIKKHNVPAVLAKRGAWFKEQMMAVAKKHSVNMAAVGFDNLPNLILVGDDMKLSTDIHRALLLEGVMPYFPLWYISYSHDEKVLSESIAAFDRALAKVR